MDGPLAPCRQPIRDTIKQIVRKSAGKANLNKSVDLNSALRLHFVSSAGGVSAPCVTVVAASING